MKKMSLWLVLGALMSITNVVQAGIACGPQTTMGRWVPDIFSTPMSPRKAVFGRACAAHDVCYGVAGVDKGFCDADFARHLRMECNFAFHDWQDEPARMACFGAASVYVAAVREFGGAYFDGAQAGAYARSWITQKMAEHAQASQPVTRGEVHGR
jgi:hypothetical protein